MIQPLGRKLSELEALIVKATGRLAVLEAENKKLAAENNFLLGEQKKSQAAIRRTRTLSDGQERIRRRLVRLRDKLVKLEAFDGTLAL